MEKNGAQPANSGISEELLKEIGAQYAIIDSAARLISQLRHNSKKNQKSEPGFGEWVYNMDFLDKWISEYTKRKRLTCPHCKKETIFNCKECDNGFEYHDEL